jgi:hypothetical protein
MSLLTSAPISRLAVELLRRELVLVGTVARIPGDEYAGPSGGTVTLRVPQPRTANEQVTPGETIEYSDIQEVPVNVKLRHLYDATRVTDEDLSLTLQDFGRQVLRPQVSAVATGAEDELADKMNTLEADAEIEWGEEPDPTEDEDLILAVRERMGDDDVPAGGRYCAVSTDVARRLLAIEKFSRADARGAAGVTALEAATLGSVYGFQFVESSALAKGSAIFYHSSGFGFGNRPPTPPGGGADSRTASEGGVSLRHITMFDANRLSTASVVSVFVGASVVPEDAEGKVIKRAIRVVAPSS